MSDERRPIDPLYGAIGSLQTAVENIDRRLDRFEQSVTTRLDKQDEKYELGKEKAQAHALKMELKDDENVKRHHIPKILKLEWLLENWFIIGIVITILSVLGVLTYSDKFKDVFNMKQTVEEKPGKKK